MFELKTIEELESAIDMLIQETDASKRTKSKHLLRRQFSLALQEVDRLKKSNKSLIKQRDEGFKNQLPAIYSELAKGFINFK